MCDLSGLYQDGGAAAMQAPLFVQRLYEHPAEAAYVPTELPALSAHDPQHYGRLSLKDQRRWICGHLTTWNWINALGFTTTEMIWCDVFF